MQFLESLLSKINSVFWGGPMLVVLCLFHLYFTIRTGFVQKKIWKGIRYSVSGGSADKDKKMLPGKKFPG